jgi:hypothetical protein
MIKKTLLADSVNVTKLSIADGAERKWGIAPASGEHEPATKLSERNRLLWNIRFGTV